MKRILFLFLLLIHSLSAKTFNKKDFRQLIQDYFDGFTTRSVKKVSALVTEKLKQKHTKIPFEAAVKRGTLKYLGHKVVDVEVYTKKIRNKPVHFVGYKMLKPDGSKLDQGLWFRIVEKDNQLKVDSIMHDYDPEAR